MHTVQEFDSFFEKFKLTEYWTVMQNTVEDSPWHREANVAVHTEMVMQQYRDQFIFQHTEVENVIALTALLFHDVGKPAAEEVLEKKDGSGEVYRRYAGHEQHSAVTFQECFMNMPELRQMLSNYGARAVRWIIEHHLPYGYKDKIKRQGLAIGTKMALAEAGASYQTFFDCLRSDAAGRISDGHEEKLQNVENWITEFLTVNSTPTAAEHGPTMFILVGPSGSGKSTWIAERKTGNDRVISYDELKILFYKHQMTMISAELLADPHALYNIAWAYANEHESEFKKFCAPRITAAFEAARTLNGAVFIDIVNASKKRRQIWVDYAKRFGFRVVGVEFWNSLDTLAARQQTRPDKSVPYSSVRQQLHAIGGIWAGFEADEVWMKVGGV